MADSLNTVKQCGETREYLYRKTLVRTSFIGSDADIKALAEVQKKGTKFSGLSSEVANSVIESSTTEKIESDRTKWNVQYSIYTVQGGSGGGGGQGEDDDSYYTSQDSMTMTQYQFPLYKYLNADESAAVASWQNLSDEETEHKKAFEYKKQGGGYEKLSDVSAKAEAVAKKLFAGIEYVQKAYPQITHVERFSSRRTMTTRQNRLNHIDTSSDVPNLIAHYSWLKTQYDWQENDDSTWTLTESWIGVPEDQPWDADLYGANSWKFFIPDEPPANDGDNNGGD